MWLIIRISIMLFFASCGSEHQDQSKLSVTNGRVVAENYLASVVRTDNCTATFVRHNVLLTAAHCVSGRSSVDVHLLERRLKSKRIITNKAYSLSDKRGVNKNDLAIIIVADYSAPAISRMCFKQPTVGEPIAIVGYGLNNLKPRQGAGIKREGFNFLAEIENDLLIFDGQLLSSDNSGYDAASASGDSGGPMFSLDGNCVMGVTSGGFIAGKRKISKYVDVKGHYLTSSFDWIHYLVSNEDLISSIGSNPIALYEHWVELGMKQGRSPNPAYYPDWYLDRNEDIPMSVREDYEALLRHWEEDGKSSCRDASPYFSAQAYLNLYPGVSEEVGGDCRKAVGHWLYIGQSHLLSGR